MHHTVDVCDDDKQVADHESDCCLNSSSNNERKKIKILTFKFAASPINNPRAGPKSAALNTKAAYCTPAKELKILEVNIARMSRR